MKITICSLKAPRDTPSSSTRTTAALYWVVTRLPRVPSFKHASLSCQNWDHRQSCFNFKTSVGPTLETLRYCQIQTLEKYSFGNPYPHFSELCTYFKRLKPTTIFISELFESFSVLHLFAILLSDCQWFANWVSSSLFLEVIISFSHTGRNTYCF